jgi:hypothetical protein
VISQRQPGGRPAATTRRAEPARCPELAHLSLPALRAYRQELVQEESRVSYWRRILQTRLDLVMQGHDTSQRQRLRSVLANHAAASRRLALHTLHAGADPQHPSGAGGVAAPPLPDLAALWDSHVVAPAADEELLARLTEAEQALSAYRASLHARLDQATGELIARYHEHPTLALGALPLRAVSRSGAA